MATKKKAPAKKAAARPKKASLSAAPISPVSAAPVPAKASSKFRLLTWVIVAGFGFYVWGPSCNRMPRTAGAPAAAGRFETPQSVKDSWGPKIELKEVSSFDCPGRIADMAAASDGSLYVVDGSTMRLFKDDKLVQTANFGAGPYRALAINGDLIAVTHSDTNYVAVFNKAMEVKYVFNVAGARRTLGVASRGAAGWAFCEVDGDKAYYTDLKGGSVKVKPGLLAKGEAIGMVYDLGVDGDGQVVANNVYARSVKRLGDNSVVFADPCSDQDIRRIAISGKTAYVGCAKDAALVLVGADGKPSGWMKLSNPYVVAAGADGFIYVQDGSEVHKYKPQ